MGSIAVNAIASDRLAIPVEPLQTPVPLIANQALDYLKEMSPIKNVPFTILTQGKIKVCKGKLSPVALSFIQPTHVNISGSNPD